MSKEDDDSLATVATRAPITSERPVLSNLEETLPKPYLARALVAPTTDKPNGAEGHEHHDWSVLQQHVAFFDQNNDGVLYPRETCAGFRQLGFNKILSIILALVFHLIFSFPTQRGWSISLLLPVHIVNIHKGKHGSDSETYDTEGRFMPVNLENVFSKYGKTQKDKLTLKEILKMIQGNARAYDIIGPILALGKWLLLYLMAKDKAGYLSKESARGLFDGSLFESIAKRNKNKKAN